MTVEKILNFSSDENLSRLSWRLDFKTFIKKISISFIHHYRENYPWFFELLSTINVDFYFENHERID